MEINPIIKEVTTDCNLRCKYCFFAKQKRKKKVISSGILKMVVLKICECNPDDQEVMFYWHGGEPLLAGIDFYRQAVKFQQRFKKPGQKIRNGIETNATLLNDDWASFFLETGFEVGVSLDGPKEYHDRYRCYPDGSGSFDDVIRGIAVLKRRKIRFSIIAVINKESVLVPDKIFDFFCLNHISNYINLVPALGIETGHGLSFECSVNPASYINFLIRVFDLWMKTSRSKLEILPLESIVTAFLGLPQEDCRFSGECRKSLVIESNGDVFACNTYSYGDFFNFGKIKDGIDEILDIYRSRKCRNYVKFLDGIQKHCKKCKWYRICKGGCPGWYYLGGGKNILCHDFKRLFEHIEKALKKYRLI